jgi:hypothetical protein
MEKTNSKIHTKISNFNTKILINASVHLKFLQEIHNLSIIDSNQISYIENNSIAILNMPTITRLYNIFFKSVKEDHDRINEYLSNENKNLEVKVKESEINNDEIFRELKIVTKEKIEIINDKNKIDEEITNIKVNNKINLRLQKKI